MTGRQKVAVVWFKTTDLRTHDHEALNAAHDSGLPVLHLFVLDPRWYRPTPLGNFRRTGSARALFQLQALQDFQSGSLEATGHSLTVRKGSTATVFKELCQDFDVKAVYASQEVCSEELRVEAGVRSELQKANSGPLKLYWTYELHRFDELPEDVRRKGAGGFSGYRRTFSERCHVPPPVPEPQFRTSTPASRWARGEALPSDVAELGLEAAPAPDDRAEVTWRGGETAGFARVQAYFFESHAIGLDFAGATNFPHEGHSSTKEGSLSKLSPWLSHGCLSARWLYAELRRYERAHQKTDSTARLVHELYFRDFVRFSSLRNGSKIFKLEGLYNRHPPGGWLQDTEGLLDAWRKGATGFPFVDAAMRELAATGHCSHAGREVAAWFLVADLGLDWRLGAEWFEARLVDYEPASNWFNWAFTCVPRATGGNSIQEEAMPRAPPRTRLQTPEVVYWAAQHDPDAEYIKRWVPELASLSPANAREPWRSAGTGAAVAVRCPGVAEETPPAVSRERERIGWVRRTFPAGGPDVLVWWGCARPGAALAAPPDSLGQDATDAKKVDPDDGKTYTLQQLCAKYKRQYTRKEVEAYWRSSCAVVELRTDPVDGKMYSLTELLQHYQKQYRRWEIEEYFAKTCTPAAVPQKTGAKARTSAPAELSGGEACGLWPDGYPLPLLPPASLASIEDVAEQSRRNQARKALKAAKLRQDLGATQARDFDASAKEIAGSAPRKRWARAQGA
eukprot:CAMPEP_0117505152 /NCGR_PEP_ID=MMETSP0784-20121206/25228_1 /TAXON_ID=39447 /ORGANISM="" /LENGTH=734 /DNA_ID=CAMNT_0005300551 /DNA_START=29 /DNA_END=2234 /DNA_ORIENTATION=+